MLNDSKSEIEDKHNLSLEHTYEVNCIYDSGLQCVFEF